MTAHQIVYMVFTAVLVLALILDLGLLSKKNTTVTIKTALYQTFFWVSLAIGFFIFLLVEGHALASENVIVPGQEAAASSQLALEFISAYLMEWSLSIDNIFVFVIIFNSFRVKQKHYPRVLLIGILMAIIFRILFITLGVALVHQFSWVLYLFGIFLLYTGYKMFFAGEDEEFDPHRSWIYLQIKKLFPLTEEDGDGKFYIKVNGRGVYTSLFVVVLLLSAIDLVFALDSIPAVMGISKDPLVIYTSNIFAVLGLRSLFFLLRTAVSKFDFLQQGIAIVLMFIGVKMLGEHYISLWIPKNIQVVISLLVIVLCISGSIFYSIFVNRRGLPPDAKAK
ncbi:MAG: TerC/Alx family metal homeostasis membrane protein [Sediminibacterium sp.]